MGDPEAAQGVLEMAMFPGADVGVALALVRDDKRGRHEDGELCWSPSVRR